MKWDTREPCGSCPYRRDSELALWSEDEFADLQAHDSNEMAGSTYGCHAHIKRPPKERGPCAGWILDQKRRGIPSIQFRLQLLMSEEAVACFEETTDGGHELYNSIEEMVAAQDY